MTTTDAAFATADEVAEGQLVLLPDGRTGVIEQVHTEGQVVLPDGTTQDASAEDPALQINITDGDGAPTGEVVAALASVVTIDDAATGAADAPDAVPGAAPSAADAEDDADGGVDEATEYEVGDGVVLADGSTGDITAVYTDGDYEQPGDGATVTATADDPVLEIALDDEATETPTGVVVYANASTVTPEPPDADDEVVDAEDPGQMAGSDAASSFAVDPTGAWEGILIVEGSPSGDGRQIQPQALTWRALPLPLMAMFRNGEGQGSGHDAAELVGSIEWVERRESTTASGTFAIWGGGHLNLGDSSGQRAMQMMSKNPDGSGPFLRGVSADLDNVEVEFENPEPSIDAPIDEQLGWDPGLMLIAAGRVMGATLCPFPAFQEAYVYLLDGADPQVADPEAVVASGGDSAFDQIVASLGAGMEGAVARTWMPCDQSALVASAGLIPNEPPAAWFEVTPHDGPYPLRVEADGRVHGYAATWDSCHIAFRDRCQPPPRSPSGYRNLCNKSTLTAEGVLAATTPVFMDTVHPDLRMRASDAQAFYAHTGCAVADVAVYDTKHGVYLAGAARRSASPEQMRAFRGSDISPDWRPIKRGQLDCVAMLCVNVSGFITEAALVASAGDVPGFENAVRPGTARMRFDAGTGEVLALVAAGMVKHDDRVASLDVLVALQADVAELKRVLAPIRLERAAARLGRSAAFSGGAPAPKPVVSPQEKPHAAVDTNKDGTCDVCGAPMADHPTA